MKKWKKENKLRFGVFFSVRRITVNGNISLTATFAPISQSGNAILKLYVSNNAIGRINSEVDSRCNYQRKISDVNWSGWQYSCPKNVPLNIRVDTQTKNDGAMTEYFQGWSDDVWENNRTITLTGDTELIAYYVPNQTQSEILTAVTSIRADLLDVEQITKERFNNQRGELYKFKNAKGWLDVRFIKEMYSPDFYLNGTVENYIVYEDGTEQLMGSVDLSEFNENQSLQKDFRIVTQRDKWIIGTKIVLKNSSSVNYSGSYLEMNFGFDNYQTKERFYPPVEW